MLGRRPGTSANVGGSPSRARRRRCGRRPRPRPPVTSRARRTSKARRRSRSGRSDGRWSKARANRDEPSRRRRARREGRGSSRPAVVPPGPRELAVELGPAGRGVIGRGTLRPAGRSTARDREHRPVNPSRRPTPRRARRPDRHDDPPAARRRRDQRRQITSGQRPHRQYSPSVIRSRAAGTEADAPRARRPATAFPPAPSTGSRRSRPNDDVDVNLRREGVSGSSAFRPSTMIRPLTHRRGRPPIDMVGTRATRSRDRGVGVHERVRGPAPRPRGPAPSERAAPARLHRVVRDHRGAPLEELGDGQGRRVAEVVGVGLEGQAEQRDAAAGEPSARASSRSTTLDRWRR